MFNQMTSSRTHSAISSPASASGPMHFAEQAGQMIDLFGPVPVRANLSPRQAKDLGLLTSGTSGRSGTTSSASAALQSFLESRLRARTQTLGSTLYALTWKPWVTPGGGVPFPSASVGAPHIRDRNFWVADAADKRRIQGRPRISQKERHGTAGNGAIGSLADSVSNRPQGRLSGRPDAQRETLDGSAGCLRTAGRPGPVNGFWTDADWLFCRDGKWRPVEPGTFPLADGAPSRVGRLRAYGNAINAEAAIAFIEASMRIAA